MMSSEPTSIKIETKKKTILVKYRRNSIWIVQQIYLTKSINRSNSNSKKDRGVGLNKVAKADSFPLSN